VVSPLLSSEVRRVDRSIHEIIHQSVVFEKGMETKSCKLVVIKCLVDNSVSRKAFVAYRVLTHKNKGARTNYGHLIRRELHV
jgi:hypothetical protein